MHFNTFRISSLECWTRLLSEIGPNSLRERHSSIITVRHGCSPTRGLELTLNVRATWERAEKNDEMIARKCPYRLGSE